MIEQSSSDCPAPVLFLFIVAEELWLFIYCLCLNVENKKGLYTTLQMEKRMNNLAKAREFTALEVNSGYWKVSPNVKSIGKLQLFLTRRDLPMPTNAS